MCLRDGVRFYRKKIASAPKNTGRKHSFRGTTRIADFKKAASRIRLTRGHALAHRQRGSGPARPDVPRRACTKCTPLCYAVSSAFCPSLPVNCIAANADVIIINIRRKKVNKMA